MDSEPAAQARVLLAQTLARAAGFNPNRTPLEVAAMGCIVRPTSVALCLIVALANHSAVAAFAPVHAGLPGSVGEVQQGVPNDGIARVAAWPFLFGGGGNKPIYDSLPNDVKPHPSVARIIVPEDGATAYGSGSLVAVRDQHGLVITNWHVVRDANGLVEVVFPDGFRSHARPLKVDQDWDLAALVIWRPSVEPVKIAAQPPRPGDILTIHGYGRGKYRIATGRCTNYYSPQPNYPHEMVELDVEARQGDSGGPIFNQQGELAGVLFGAGQGTTMGSFAPRVRNFLAAVAPDFDQAGAQSQVAVADRPAPNVHPPTDSGWTSTPDYPSSPWSPKNAGAQITAVSAPAYGAGKDQRTEATAQRTSESCAWSHGGWYDPAKSLLAIVGLVTIGLQVVRLVK